ncbi:hypothetical protein FSP39_007768 [Pinctada imbricata]|uniref:Uncharacterized protein n=1 Tax=Pinctada imbricata TaxID=66713 RepID=A0AA88XU53_PINIB|nr:hypothetical protein FSP39_007768 [Pinctada imbricata]
MVLCWPLGEYIKLQKLLRSTNLKSYLKLRNTYIQGSILQGRKSGYDSSRCNGLILKRTYTCSHPGSIAGFTSICDSVPKTLVTHPLGRQLSTSNEAAEMEAWEMLVDYSRLSPLEKKNHERHVQACRSHKEFYRDVATGYQVMTRHAHLQRGNCCGNACRHCPYGHKSVPQGTKPKTFNSAYYV